MWNPARTRCFTITKSVFRIIYKNFWTYFKMTSSKTNIMIFVFLCAGKTMSFWTLEPSCRKKPKLHVKFSEVSHDWYTLVIFPAIYTFFDSVLNRKFCCLKKKIWAQRTPLLLWHAKRTDYYRLIAYNSFVWSCPKSLKSLLHKFHHHVMWGIRQKIWIYRQYLFG